MNQWTATDDAMLSNFLREYAIDPATYHRVVKQRNAARDTADRLRDDLVLERKISRYGIAAGVFAGVLIMLIAGHC